MMGIFRFEECDLVEKLNDSVTERDVISRSVKRNRTGRET